MNLKNFLRYFPLVFLVLASFLTRFYHLDYPPKVVFDETHHALYATKYLFRQYYFDTHPPLGKMLFALAGALAKNKTDFDFGIGKEYQNFNYLALRSVTALLGSLFVILIYFFVKELGFSQRVAFLASFLILFDNAFLVQSRFILLDIILVFFIFLSLYLFLLTKRYQPFSKKWYLFHFLAGLAIGSAFSIKWPGLGVLLMIWGSEIVLDSFFSKSKKEKLTKVFFLLILPFLLYFFFFFLHFQLAYSPCYSNCGAIIEKIQKLIPEPANKIFTIPPSGNFLKKFFTTHLNMLSAAFGENYFPYRSPWWSWPLMIKPVPYFYDKVGEKISIIYFLGNPFVWGLGIIGIFGFFYSVVKKMIFISKSKSVEESSPKNFLFVALGWIVYFFSFAGIGRQVPVYYYLPALAFSLILFSIFLEEILKKIFKSEKEINIMFLIISLLTMVTFVCILPFSYGIPIFYQ